MEPERVERVPDQKEPGEDLRLPREPAQPRGASTRAGPGDRTETTARRRQTRLSSEPDDVYGHPAAKQATEKIPTSSQRR